MKWFRDGVELKEGKKYEMRKDGFSRTLIVKSSESKDSGSYSCQTTEDKLEFKVQVKGVLRTELVHNTEILCRRLHKSHSVPISFQIQL